MSRSTIDDRLDADYAPAWRPDPGDKLTGEVVALGERQGQYAPYVIVTLRRDDGEEFAIHAFHGVLAEELAKLRPSLGDRIAVKYVDKVQNKSGTGTYHSYRVVSDTATGGVDWSKYGGDGSDDDSGSDLPSTSDATTATAPAVAADDEPLPF